MGCTSRLVLTYTSSRASVDKCQQQWKDRTVGKLVDPDDLIDTTGVAEVLGVASHRVVSVLRSRHRDTFPAPLVHMGRGRCMSGAGRTSRLGSDAGGSLPMVKGGDHLFDGCYEAARAAALSGVPSSTVYDWARKGVVVPSISLSKPKLWSYADLMALRIVYWLRHPKLDEDIDVAASTMSEVRRALSELVDNGMELWSAADGPNASPLVVDRSGHIYIDDGRDMRTVKGQGVIGRDVLNVLGPFDLAHEWAPDLRAPMPHLRIVPGKVSGEPHLERSRLTTPAVAALARRGFDQEAIRRLYPMENPEGLREAVELEQLLDAA